MGGGKRIEELTAVHGSSVARVVNSRRLAPPRRYGRSFGQTQSENKGSVYSPATGVMRLAGGLGDQPRARRFALIRLGAALTAAKKRAERMVKMTVNFIL